MLEVILSFSKKQIQLNFCKEYSLHVPKLFYPQCLKAHYFDISLTPCTKGITLNGIIPL